MVISHHHQGIEDVATTLEVWAQSPDGLAEGVRRKDTVNYPCYLGVQWHPEFFTDPKDPNFLIVKALIDAA